MNQDESAAPRRTGSRRREGLFWLAGLAASGLGILWVGRLARAGRAVATDSDIGNLDLPHSRWHELLSPAAYAVLFEEDTERPFSSPLDHERRAGTYLCAACFLPLFSSATKFESGTGWPSFYDHLPGSLGTRRDLALLLPRTEYHCARCGGHQGHVFDDGPPPTGLRYCNNGVALRFIPAGQDLPALREAE